MKKLTLGMIVALVFSLNASAANYSIDVKGAHAFINFKIKHLGYSWLTGRFNKFSGEFSYDAKNPNAASITVDIDTTSIDSNHAERDKHIRSSDYMNFNEFTTARFASSKITQLEGDKLKVEGNLTLHGVTKPIIIDAVKIGEGKDPWGGYRAGFSGTTQIRLGEFGMPEKLGPASSMVMLELHIEGIRK